MKKGEIDIEKLMKLSSQSEFIKYREKYAEIGFSHCYAQYLKEECGLSVPDISRLMKLDRTGIYKMLRK
ncbi:MAG: hypothetical protein FWE54_05380 [Methanimicrococcus sp.]|nr:hypothetical protein [Methanimicrococcus sp.]